MNPRPSFLWLPLPAGSVFPTYRTTSTLVHPGISSALESTMHQLRPEPAPALLLALFTQVRRRRILGSPHPETCIAPVLTRQDRPPKTPLCWTGAIYMLWWWIDMR
jgi:hypothetical protein